MADKKDLQSITAEALKGVPAYLLKGIDQSKLKVVEGKPTQGYNHPAIASVPDDQPNTIVVHDADRYSQPGAASQVLAHELTHSLMDKASPAVKFAPINQQAPYDYDQSAVGGKITNYSPEQIAAMVQTNTAYQNDPTISAARKAQIAQTYAPIEQQLQNLPQASISTDQQGQSPETMNTTPNAPRAEYDDNIVTPTEHDAAPQAAPADWTDAPTSVQGGLQFGQQAPADWEDAPGPSPTDDNRDALSRAGSGFAAGSQTTGLGTAIMDAATQPSAGYSRALDHYHDALAAFKSGDDRGAAEAASKFLLTAAKLGLQKAYAPQIEAVKMMLLDPVKAIQEQRSINNKAASASPSAIGDGGAGIKAVWDKAKQDWKANNPDAALTDVLAGTVGQPGVEGIPLVGSVVRNSVNALDKMTHRTVDGKADPDTSGELGFTAGALAAPIVSHLTKGLVGKRGGGFDAMTNGQSVADAADTAANVAKQHDDMLQANRDKFQQQLQDSLDKAETASKDAKNQISSGAVAEKNVATGAAKARSLGTDTAHESWETAISDSLDTAKQKYADQFKQALQTQTTGASAPEDLAPKINEGIDRYEQKSHEDFEEGMNGKDGVIDRLSGTTEPVIGSPLQKKAAELLKKPTPDDHPLNLGAKGLAGVKLDGQVQKWLQNASEGTIEVEAPGPADEAGNPTTQMVKKPMGDLTADQLVGIRQNLREASTQFQRGDLNRRVLGIMLGSVDDTLEKLAESAGDPQVLKDYGELRKNYKTARSNLDTTTADKLRLDSPDKAMGDVSKYLLTGNNAASKIGTIGSMVGEHTMQGVRQTFVQQLSEMSPEEAFKSLDKIPDDAKQAFFGPEFDGKLTAARSLYEKSVASAEQAATTQTQEAASAAAKLSSQSSAQAVLDRQLASADAKARTQQINNEYNTAKQKATDLSLQQNAPYNTKFAKAISDGSIGQKLADKTVATADINSLKTALGPSDFGKIQQGVWHRAMADSMAGGHFDPGKFLGWYDSMDDDVRRAMFDVAKPDVAQMVSDLRDAKVKQNLVKAGLVVPTLAATGAAVSLIPQTVLSGVLETAVALTGVLAGRTLVPAFLEYVSTHPTTWKAMSAVSKVKNTARDFAGAAGTTLGAGRNIVPPAVLSNVGQKAKTNPSMRNVYSSVADSLAGK